MTRKQKLKVFIPLAVLGLVATGYLGLAGFARFVWANRHEPRTTEILASAEKHFPAFIADLEVLESNPIFPEWKQEKNAEPFLSKYIAWGDDPSQKPKWDNHTQLLTLIERHKNLKDLEKWNAFAGDPDVLALDVSWVDELKTFDHWSFKTNPAYVKIASEGPLTNSIERIGMWATSPIPEMKQFQYSLLARLVQLSSQGEQLKGFENFRHGAHLMHTSSTLIGEMMAISLVNQERQLVEFTRFGDWQTVDEERALAYKRVAWGWGGVMQVLHWKPERMQDFEAYAKPTNAICGGVLETILTGSLWGDFLDQRMPLETDFSAEVRNAREVTANFLDRCGLAEYKAMTNATPAGANPLFAPKFSGTWTAVDGGGFSLPLNPSRVPFVRRMVGFELMTIAMPGWMRQYEEREPAAEVKPAAPAEAGS